jgi:hypothetical protein
MKTQKLLILFTLLCLVFASCDNSTTSKTETVSVKREVTMASLLTDDDCFDERMEKWFVEFNQLQNSGLDMNEANEKAIAVVSVELRDCNKEPLRTAVTKEEE